MRIGTASAYRDELAVTCSGSRETPTATIRTTDGWTAVTTAPAGGFGASDMKVTSPEGEEASFPASATQGPVWKDKSFASIFGRHMTVDSQEWRLYLQDVSCA
ncbi:hypothetical protein FM114_01485 [Luteococcus japonicus LSP_Lj1]|uniref:Uncharacterized protein n=2 Tax=Luteococcus japonicus TaxID=33984 RepID=A0A1R4IFH0_9ACTN|nr:hypothetical protein FM114_01485 [Luteococcus japonicus LSP_Lj1]